MQTQAQMIAFTEALLDRMAWYEGRATEQHIPEPPRGTPTLPPPPKAALRAAEACAVDPHADTQPGEAGWSHSERQPEPAYLDLGGWLSPW